MIGSREAVDKRVSPGIPDMTERSPVHATPSAI